MNAIKKAEDALARIRGEKARCARELDEQRAALVALESSAGEKILAARLDADQTAEDAVTAALVAARAKIDATERALAASTTAIKKAQHGVFVAQAAGLRSEAARLWKEVAPRLAESNAMLDALAEREGCHWMPFPGVHPTGCYLDGSWTRTRTGELLFAIVELERNATHLESVAGVPPGPSCLPDFNTFALHLGNVGVARQGPQLKSEPAKKTTGEDIVKAYRDSQSLRG
jgi:hypothetical protein